MKIVVLSGSPKGENSVTLQYIAYWRKCFPMHEYEVVHVARKLPMLEKKPEAFDAVMEKVAKADLVLWAFPLYFLLVHSSYMRFIELIFERKKERFFHNKYAAAITTSIHFFDHTAHSYIHAVCDDLGMNFIEGVPAHMRDLFDADMRKGFRAIFQRWLEAVEMKTGTLPANAPVRPDGTGEYRPATAKPKPLSRDARVTIVADLPPDNPSIHHMLERFQHSFPGAEVIRLRDIRMGPCTGCLKCGMDNHCVYEGKDDYIQLHRERVLSADILVFAGVLKGRYLSSTWQRYLERSFNRTHQPTLTGKQVAFLISGPLSQNANVREVLSGYTETMGGNLVSFITDESPDPRVIDSAIDATARILYRYSEAGIRQPISFLGTGGMKIFRDEIFAGLRFVFQGDHRYFKKHGIYDFPHKQRMMPILMHILIPLSRIPFLRKKIRARISLMMTKPYRKVLAKARPAE